MYCRVQLCPCARISNVRGRPNACPCKLSVMAPFRETAGNSGSATPEPHSLGCFWGEFARSSSEYLPSCAGQAVAFIITVVTIIVVVTILFFLVLLLPFFGRVCHPKVRPERKRMVLLPARFHHWVRTCPLGRWPPKRSTKNHQPSHKQRLHNILYILYHIVYILLYYTLHINLYYTRHRITYMYMLISSS